MKGKKFVQVRAVTCFKGHLAYSAPLDLGLFLVGQTNFNMIFYRGFCFKWLTVQKPFHRFS